MVLSLIIVRIDTENLKWLCLIYILSEIFTYRKCEVKNIIFMFVACLYSRHFRHIENR